MPPKRKTILIVDDDPILKSLLRDELEAAGVNVLAASTAFDDSAQGAQAAATVPDAVILDIGLPGMDGFRATSVLRNRHPGARFPIVYATSFPEDYLRNAGSAAGGDYFVLKPFEVESLVRDLLTLTGARRPGRGAPQFELLRPLREPAPPNTDERDP